MFCISARNGRTESGLWWPVARFKMSKNTSAGDRFLYYLWILFIFPDRNVVQKWKFWYCKRCRPWYPMSRVRSIIVCFLLLSPNESEALHSLRVGRSIVSTKKSPLHPEICHEDLQRLKKHWKHSLTSADEDRVGMAASMCQNLSNLSYSTV